MPVLYTSHSFVISPSGVSYNAIAVSQFLASPHSFSCFHTCPFLCIYFCTSKKGSISTTFSLRLPIYVVILWYLFLTFTDHFSMWQTLGSSTSLQLTQFSSFLWLTNIPIVAHIPQHFYPSSVYEISGLLHFLAIVNSYPLILMLPLSYSRAYFENFSFWVINSVPLTCFSCCINTKRNA